MPIAVDAMGGDFAPQSAVEGAVRAAADDHASILLVGDRARLEAELARHPEAARLDGRIGIVHAEEVVGMDEPAITPIRKKRRSSVRICAELDRKSTRLNSSHMSISYAVVCLKKKTGGNAAGSVGGRVMVCALAVDGLQTA